MSPILSVSLVIIQNQVFILHFQPHSGFAFVFLIFQHLETEKET